jgi:hypothetical protein
MADTPSWLAPGNEAPAPAAGGSTTLEVDNGVGSAPAASANYGVTENQDNDLPGIILTMRLANMGVAAGLITISVRSFQKTEIALHDIGSAHVPVSNIFLLMIVSIRQS